MTFSVKGKVLFGLAILITSVIAANSFYAYKLFLEDKTNYIFESGLKRAEDISDQIVSPINQTIKKINPYILLASQSKEQFTRILNSDDRVSFFSYKSNENDWSTFTREVEDSDGVKRGDPLREWFKNNVSKIQFNENVLVKGLKVAGNYFSLVTLEQGTQKIAIMLNFTDIVTLLNDSSVFNFYLPTSNGKPFFPVENKIPQYAQAILDSPISKGAREVEVNNNEKYLISFVKFPGLGFSLISEISKEKAFAVADSLIMKTSFFGLIVLGIGLIFGLGFSLTVTRPINSLVNATRWVAEGDFSKRVSVQSKDEFRILGDSFNFMSSEIQEMVQKLEDYNKNLEKKVEERTAELKKANVFIETMINSLDQGLLVFDKELKVSNIFTKACVELFGMDLSGKTYPEVLGLNEKESGAVEKWSQIVFTEKIPFASASRLGPQKMVLGEGVDDERFKHVSLEYHPMRSDDGIDNIVAVATDKTNEIRAIEAFNEKEAYVEMILKLVHSKKQFYSFLDEANDILNEIRKTLSQDSPSLDSLMINYHSLNGGFGTYSVYSLQKMARACEQYIVDSRNDEFYSLNRLRSDYDDFLYEYQKFQKEIDLIFGEKKDIVEIDRALIIYFSEILKEKADTETALLFKEYFEKEAVEEHFEGYKDLVKTLSLRLGKPISPLKIRNGDIRIPPEKTKEFFSALVHLFRNCVDHGIEDSNTRIERHKPEQGSIVVEFNKERRLSGEDLIVVVEDDGGGIDPEKIREKWKSIHPEDHEIDSLSDDEIIYKIFDPNFSTAESVTDVSGRGVGMSAIKEVIDKSGGSLEVESKVGQGSSFTFRIPLS